MSSRRKGQQSERLSHTFVSKWTALLVSSCMFVLLASFPGSCHATALHDRTLDASRDSISLLRRDHVPKWNPTRVHYPAFSDAALVPSAEIALVNSSINDSSVPQDTVEANFKLSFGTLLPPLLQRDRRLLFMINAYEFNATESHVVNTLQTLTSWCERGEEVHVALYTTSHELASYVSDKKQRFFCQRLSSSLPIAVLEYDKNITINIAGMHRYLVADNIDKYDWFLYTEDDLRLTHSHVRHLKKWTRVLAPKGTLPHLMRYEVAPVRPLGLKRDALLLDEYPLPLSLYLMDITDTEMAARGLDLDFHDEKAELDDERDDPSKESAALWFSAEDEKGRHENDREERPRDEKGRDDNDRDSTLKNNYQGDVTSLLSHRRRRRRHQNSRGDGSQKQSRTDPFSLTKTFRGRNVLTTSHTQKNGTVFVRVPNPYMAMWLLPRDILLSRVLESRWLDEVNDCPSTDVRVHFATFWLLAHFSFAVPLSSLRRAFIHHVSTKYAGHGLTQVDADRRETSHPFFLHRYYNVDAWDLERTLSECTEDYVGKGIGGDNNEDNAAAAADDDDDDDDDDASSGAAFADASASVRTDTLLHKHSSTYKRLLQRHPFGTALQSPRLLSNSMCSSCLNLGGNVTINVAKREKGEPLEYKVDCLRSKRKRQ